MRRQVKPFVTEYRASTRKPKDGLTAPTEEAPPREDHSRSWAEMASEAALPMHGGSDAMRAADALFQRSTVEVAPSPSATRTENGGAVQRRILESLEPAPTSVAEASLPQAMPRRRGRKPGSKNKPKAAVAQPTIAVTHLQADLTSTPIPSTRSPTVLALTGSVRPVAAARRRDAFSWVRKTLKPGERWKRRLPKVAW